MNQRTVNLTCPADRGVTRGDETQQPVNHINLDPATTYEVLTRQMVEDLAAQVAAIRNRIDTLFWVILASVTSDTLLRLAGA